MPEVEIPQYRVLEDSFIAPRKVLAGSIIATHGSPGPHLEPLNAAAEAMMEAWYNEEHPSVDRKGVPDGGTWKPHERYRIRQYEPGEVHETEVLAEPAADEQGGVSLAASMYVGKTDTDQRPGPAGKVKTTPVAAPPLVPVEQAMAEQSDTKLIEAAPETTTVKRS